MTAVLAAVLLAWAAAAVSRRGRGRAAGLPAWRRHRRDQRLVDALPGLLEAVAADLRSGGTVFGALEAAARPDGPLAGDLGRMVERVRAGLTLVAALEAWPEERRGIPAVKAVAGAFKLAVTVGGRSAAPLEGLAAALDDRRSLSEEVAALSAQARASAVVVGAAPVGSLALSTLADGRVAGALVGTAAGRACLATGLVLEGLAAAWMRRIVRAAEA